MTEKFWLIWNGSIERCDFPTHIHYSLEEANREAERLARLHRGQVFSVLQLVGTCQSIDVKWDYLANNPNDPPF